MAAEDIQCLAPVRITRRRSEQLPKKEQMHHLFEDYHSLDFRITGLVDTSVAWAEEPASRTRRLITNVLTWQFSCSPASHGLAY